MARLKTVIAQQSNHGSIHVLAAFASEGMGLRRHVETVVRPWLTANTRWALNNHRLLLGAYEDVEQQNEFDLLQVVEDLLGAIGKNREAGGKPGATTCLISSAKPRRGHFSRAFKLMGPARSC